MTPEERQRLLDEELPTGRFGGPVWRAPRPAYLPPLTPTPPQEQAANAAALDSEAAAAEYAEAARLIREAAQPTTEAVEEHAHD